jgi:hypothetical protein
MVQKKYQVTLVTWPWNQIVVAVGEVMGGTKTSFGLEATNVARTARMAGAEMSNFIFNSL